MIRQGQARRFAESATEDEKVNSVDVCFFPPLFLTPNDVRAEEGSL